MVQALKTGCHVEVAADFAGIGTTTYYRWMALGREQPEGQYGRFRAAVENALAAAEVHSLATLRAAFAQRPDMILAFLGRRHPERWGARPRHGDPHAGGSGTRGADSLEIGNPAVRLHLSAALEESRKEHERAD
jgi:hypothetical protein